MFLTNLPSSLKEAWEYTHHFKQEFITITAISAIAYSVLGKKILVILITAATLCFYYRHFLPIKAQLITLISAIFSLPFCIFLGTPFLAIPSGFFLIYYVLKNMHAQTSLIEALEKQLTDLQKNTQLTEDTSKKAKQTIKYLEEFLDEMGSQSLKLNQVKDQEEETNHILRQTLTDINLQEKLGSIRQTHTQLSNLTGNLEALPLQIQTTLDRLNQLNLELFNIIEILQKKLEKNLS